ncbi:Glu/Leu/Phe/Val dehydrogenase [Xanthobacter tagetidis]|jgi:leucine dehydrogenase|uniref:Glu/Leu/Phe/Val dehydrogenase n=2 Tax=Xanthobacter tagetidis TaxID=60216 RepID=A0A3L7A8R9_9HYPH|nr:Glu/Leu/Phe/Val dehydrogenase [Xanthobacter tagetidis]
MTLRISRDEDDGQRIFRFADPSCDLAGVIVVDSLALGPATGGCRFWPYDDAAAMLCDARRLARGMSYKNAMAGLPLGGGKSVIRRPEGSFDRAALFAAFGRVLDEIGGDYLAAEDVGTTPADMEAVRAQTPFVFGLPADGALAGGDPSPWTALGVFLSIGHICARRGISLSDSRIAVQGLGNVGADLCRRLHEAGARLVVADLHAHATDRLRADIPVDVVAPEAIHAADVDLFAPCALGGGLNRTTIPEIKARLIAGAANNQLGTGADAALLHARGILYVPDFVANAGGIINVAAEYLGHDRHHVVDAVHRIPDRLADVLDRAEAADISPAHVADAMARDLIARAAGAMAGNEGKRPL